MADREGGKTVVLAGAGLAADAVAISAAIIVGGRALVWALAVAGIIVGVAVLARGWGKPFNTVAALAATAALLSAAVLGFAIGQGNSAPAASGGAPPTRETSTTTPPTTTTQTTTTAQTTTTQTTTTQTTTAPTATRVLTSGSEALFVDGGKVDLDDTGPYDIDITERSVDGLDGTQFSAARPNGAEPGPAECAATPADQWRGALELEEFRRGATYCLRTADGHPGFFIVREAEVDVSGIVRVHARWAIWG